MSSEVKIDEKLLDSLGRRVPSMPVERPTQNDVRDGNPATIIQPLNPPKEFSFGIDLSVPKR